MIVGRRDIDRKQLWQYIGIAALVVLAVIMGIAAFRSVAPSAAQPNDAPNDTGSSLVVVSVLSDSHAYNAGSWWRQTIVAGAVPGAEMGAFQSQPGAESTSLVKRLDAAAADGGLVLVQAGTNDIIAGKTPAEALTGIEALWDGIKQRGATPVAMLEPPSDKHGGKTVALNDLIRQAAKARHMALIDVFTVVANSDGTWKDGLTKDGIHANAAGSAPMAAAAQTQLTALVAKQ